MSSRLLLDEAPVTVQPALASILGIEKAIIVQNIHWEASGNQQRNWERCFVDGQWWCTKKVDEMRERLYFIKERSFKQYMSDLQKSGIVVSIEPREGGPWDHSKWWRIDLNVLDGLVDKNKDVTTCTSDSAESAPSRGYRMHHREGIGCTIEGESVAPSYKDNERSLERTLEGSFREGAENDLVVDDFEPLPPPAPKRTRDREKAEKDAKSLAVMQWFRSAVYASPENEPVPPAEAGAMRQASYDLLAVNVTKEQLFAAAAAWPTGYPLTLHGLAKHWTRLLKESGINSQKPNPAVKAPSVAPQPQKGPGLSDDITVLGMDPETTLLHIRQGIGLARQEGKLRFGVAPDIVADREVLVEYARKDWMSVMGQDNRPWERVGQ